MDRFVVGMAGTALAIALVGCAIEPSQRAQRIRPAYPEMVAKCEFLGGVTGKSSFMIGVPLTEQVARYQAMDEAAKIGATHLVWGDVTGAPIPTAFGRAYYCDPDREMPPYYRYVDQYLRVNRYPYDGERE